MTRAGILLVGFAIAVAGLWLAFPSLVSLALETWLHRQGFEDVFLRIGYPGWRQVFISEVRLARELNGERFTAQLRGSELEYSLTGLLTLQLDRVTLPDVSVSLTRLPHSTVDEGGGEQAGLPDESISPLNMLRVDDLVQGFPALPFVELRLGQVTISREQATGPLRVVRVAGTVGQQPKGLLAELSLQGVGTQPYVLRIADLATRVMTLQLETQGPSPKPIITWRSEALVGEVRVQLRGMLDVNIQQLAPFLALLLPLGTDWQQATGRIQANWAGTASSTAALASVWRDPDTQVQGTIQVGLTLPELAGLGKKLAIAASAKFVGNTTELRWSIEPGTIVTSAIEAKKIAAFQSVRTFLPAGPQSFRVEISREIDGVLRWSDSPPRFTVAGPVVVSYDAATGPVHIELRMIRLSGHGREIDAAEGQFEVVGSLPNAVSEPYGFQQIKANVEGSLSLDGRKIRGTIHPSSSLTATRFRQGRISLTHGRVRLSEILPVRFDRATGVWEAGSSTVLLKVDEMRLAKHRVTVTEAMFRLEEMNGSSLAWKGQGTAKIQGLRVAQPAGRSMPVNLTARLSVDQRAIKADIQADTQDKSVTVNAQAQHALATGRGGLEGRLGPVSFDRTGFRVRQLWNPWPFSMDMTAGTLTATFDLDWEGGPNGLTVKSTTSEIILENLAGQYRDLTFHGFNTTLHVIAKVPDRIMTSRPAEITVASIDQGVEATHVSLAAQVDWNFRESLPSVEVRDLRCELLGGVITSQGVRADLARPPYSFTVTARALDLAKILSLEQQRGLQGTGLLDGTVPITVKSRGVIVEDGSLEARPPGGVIQYQPSAETATAMTGANENMQLVLQALNNFHYNVLQVGAQYAEDGTLNLSARLEGRNPDLKKTPPVHFNLTVQENIPALLKSLMLVQEIEDSLGSRFVRP